MCLYTIILLSLQDVDGPYPLITVRTVGGSGRALSADSVINIKMDGVDLFGDNQLIDISSAISSLMAVYYAYDVCYPPVLKDTLNFLDFFLLKVQPPARLRPKLIRVHEKLLA